MSLRTISVLMQHGRLHACTDSAVPITSYNALVDYSSARTCIMRQPSRAPMTTANNQMQEISATAPFVAETVNHGGGFHGEPFIDDVSVVEQGGVVEVNMYPVVLLPNNDDSQDQMDTQLQLRTAPTTAIRNTVQKIKPEPMSQSPKTEAGVIVNEAENRHFSDGPSTGSSSSNAARRDQLIKMIENT